MQHPPAAPRAATLGRRRVAARAFALFVGALAWGGCGATGYFGGSAPPQPLTLEQAAPPVSAVHYRDFASADALATYLRYRPGGERLVSAHRGGPTRGLPENALATFEYALNFAPALVECDVRPTRDGRLVLLHDATLERTTTGTGPLAARTFAEVRALRLEDNDGLLTPFRVPTLDEALAWAEGRAVLMLDVKGGVEPAALVEAVRRADAGDRAVVIVYTLEDLLTYTRLAPELNYSATVETAADLDALVAAGVDLDRIIAFGGVGALDAGAVRGLHARGVRVQVGTFGATDEAAAAQGPGAYAALLAQGADVLATDNVPTAALAVRPTPTLGRGPALPPR